MTTAAPTTATAPQADATLPIAKTPIAKTPGAKTPGAKTPVAKTPVAKTPAAHGVISKFFHWATAILLVFGYLRGVDDPSILLDPANLRLEIIFASIFGAAFAARLLWMRFLAKGGPSRLPQEAAIWEHWASRAVHVGLYAAVFSIVLTGFGIAYGYGQLTPQAGFTQAMIALHEFSVDATTALIILHIGGALWHLVVRRDGVTETMTGRASGRWFRRMFGAKSGI